MLRLTVVLLLVIASVCGSLIVSVRATALRPVAAEAFAATLAGCALPCWQGVTPGETRSDDALTRLDGHAWLNEVRLSYGSIYWGWSGQQPALYDDRYGGYLTLDGDRIYEIGFSTRLALAEAARLIGEPATRELDFIFTSSIYSPDAVTFTLGYPAMQLEARVTCPARMIDLLQAETRLVLHGAGLRSESTEIDATWVRRNLWRRWC